MHTRFICYISLVPRPEEEEEKGPGFSHSCMGGGIPSLSHTYFPAFVTPNIDTQSVDL